ncbi:MAG: PAS domain S-box protein, partial [Rhodospirillales bacterium]|nr:PAS domain S-box protein [Rhodospirillales bacterium]
MADPETDKRLVARLGRVLIASANEFHIFHADTLQLLALSDGARRNLGYAAEENPQLTPVDILPEFSRGRFECLTSPLRTRKQSDLTFTTMVRRRDGSTYPAEIRLQFSAEDQPPVFIAAIQDSSETQAREAELLRVSRAMMALTRATEVLIHAESEQELLDEVCRIIVELAGYRLCWLGYAMPDRTVRPVAQCGFD